MCLSGTVNERLRFALMVMTKRREGNTMWVHPYRYCAMINISTDVCIRSRTNDRHRCWSNYRCSYHHRCHHRRHYSAQKETVSRILSFFVNFLWHLYFVHWWSFNFMSCYFMPCKLVRQFHVRHFHVQHFQRTPPDNWPWVLSVKIEWRT